MNLLVRTGRSQRRRVVDVEQGAGPLSSSAGRQPLVMACSSGQVARNAAAASSVSSSARPLVVVGAAARQAPITARDVA
ncbi:hypothetical protein [Nannocystis exedens]|uniref:hypothetical protein n=1 Tax=Nannocystis exedens TaxID=54 RepID=UPI0011603F4C|nr:hypothetical protein [Nannocystis exedens]